MANDLTNLQTYPGTDPIVIKPKHDAGVPTPAVPVSRFAAALAKMRAAALENGLANLSEEEIDAEIALSRQSR